MCVVALLRMSPYHTVVGDVRARLKTGVAMERMGCVQSQLTTTGSGSSMTARELRYYLSILCKDSTSENEQQPLTALKQCGLWHFLVMYLTVTQTSDKDGWFRLPSIICRDAFNAQYRNDINVMSSLVMGAHLQLPSSAATYLSAAYRHNSDHGVLGLADDLARATAIKETRKLYCENTGTEIVVDDYAAFESSPECKPDIVYGDNALVQSWDYYLYATAKAKGFDLVVLTTKSNPDGIFHFMYVCWMDQIESD